MNLHASKIKFNANFNRRGKNHLNMNAWKWKGLPFSLKKTENPILKSEMCVPVYNFLFCLGSFHVKSSRHLGSVSGGYTTAEYNGFWWLRIVAELNAARKSTCESHVPASIQSCSIFLLSWKRRHLKLMLLMSWCALCHWPPEGEHVLSKTATLTANTRIQERLQATKGSK